MSAKIHRGHALGGSFAPLRSSGLLGHLGSPNLERATTGPRRGHDGAPPGAGLLFQLCGIGPYAVYADLLRARKPSSTNRHLYGV
ncbi:unnamed protein product [Boreogadus saida]